MPDNLQCLLVPHMTPTEDPTTTPKERRYTFDTSGPLVTRRATDLQRRLERLLTFAIVPSYPSQLSQCASKVPMARSAFIKNIPRAFKKPWNCRRQDCRAAARLVPVSVPDRFLR